MTLTEKYKACIQRLCECYVQQESESIIRILFCHLLKCNFADLRTSLHTDLTPTLGTEIEQAMQRLLRYEPIQYVTGIVYFDNLTLKVNKHVLIPRPETEELVLKLNTLLQKMENPTVLDFCTGSGCIALGIKHHINNATVVGIDISSEAIKVAQENAKFNNCTVDFFEDDIFCPGHNLNSIIKVANVFISNPPYVTANDKEAMHKNVLVYEPHIALFDYSSHAMSFYMQLALLMKQAPNLRLAAFEINEKKGKEIVELFSNHGFANCKIEKDLTGKDRFAFIHC